MVFVLFIAFWQNQAQVEFALSAGYQIVLPGSKKCINVQVENNNFAYVEHVLPGFFATGMGYLDHLLWLWPGSHHFMFYLVMQKKACLIFRPWRKTYFFLLIFHWSCTYTASWSRVRRQILALLSHLLHSRRWSAQTHHQFLFGDSLPIAEIAGRTIQNIFSRSSSE